MRHPNPTYWLSSFIKTFSRMNGSCKDEDKPGEILKEYGDLLSEI